ncbi:hypothetical protein BTVI_37409 [Pitangus sulphuratus]|nr:hypothetical protein BTVI_37409 [Pitangus sulphuratus]
MNLDRFLGHLTPPVAWDFTPEQIFNPNKLTCHLIDGCLAYSNQNQQLLALYWGLACACRAAVQYSQKTMTEAETQTIMPEVVIAAIVKKKTWVRTTGPTGLSRRLVREEEGEGEETTEGSTGEGEEAKPGISGVTTPLERVQLSRDEVREESEVIWSLTPSEFWDLQRYYSHQPGE